MTSSIRTGSMAVRSTRAFRITAPRSPAVTLARAPRNFPTGVRIGETMAARFMEVLRCAKGAVRTGSRVGELGGWMAGSQDYAPDPRNAAAKVWLNGQLLARDEAKVSIFDAGFSMGD